MGQRPLVMWSAVGSASQSQLSLVYQLQSVACLVGSRLVGIDPHSVRGLMVLHAFVKSRGGGCPDSVHLACVHCFTVSCGGTDDTSC